jgi:hypothetical protein
MRPYPTLTNFPPGNATPFPWLSLLGRSRIRGRPALACERSCRRSPTAFGIRQLRPFENRLRQSRSRLLSHWLHVLQRPVDRRNRIAFVDLREQRYPTVGTAGGFDWTREGF